jgi:hypothetical protein
VRRAGLHRTVLILATVGAALAVAPASASATTWNGSCEMTGQIVLHQPYHWYLEARDYEIVTDGTCTGTLDGAPYKGPAHYHIDGRMHKPMSCGFGTSNDVPGSLTLGSDPSSTSAKQVDVYQTEARGITELFYHLDGAYNGHAVGKLDLSPGPDEIDDCLSSEGLKYVGITHQQLETVTTLYG